MSWIRNKSTLRLLRINTLLLIAFWLIAEFAFFFVNPFNESSYRIQCNYDWILYNYCPNVVDVKRNTKDDGNNVVRTFTNTIGQRVESFSAAYPDNPEHVFIGDSFIQAEEMEFQKTFYGRLSSLGYPVSALGYSSWNIIQYREAIEKLAHLDTHYHVFLMPNDINPGDFRSVYQERLKNPAKRDNSAESPSFRVKLNRVFNNSLTNLIIGVYQKFKLTSRNSTLSPITTTLFDAEHLNDCRPLDELEDVYQTTLGYDYLVYSKPPSCWSKLHIEAADQALEELERLLDTVSDLNSTVTFYMIPPGWAFSYQNTNGRQGNSYYFFGNETRVTTLPLITYLASKLQGVDFVNLELLISDWLADCANCTNHFYFSDDGHWTPKAHEYIAEYLRQSFIIGRDEN